jgi:hypothetical protein
MCAVRVSGIGGGGVGWCLAVVGPGGGVVMAGELAYHLQAVEGVARASVCNESARWVVTVFPAAGRISGCGVPVGRPLPVLLVRWLGSGGPLPG